MSTNTYLALIPRDGLFCKDGRGWHTSSSGRGHALDWPWPSTVLGALRTAWGRKEEGHIGRRFARDEWPARTAHVTLGRTLVLRRPLTSDWSRAHRVWPVPADALWLEGRQDVVRLDPRAPRLPTLGIDDDEAREALWVATVDDASKPLRPPRWWTEDAMVAWLSGASVAASEAGSLRTHRRVQAHVGIRPETLTADEGVLFAHDVVETLELDAEWAVGVEMQSEKLAKLTLATIGSDSRIARIEGLPASLFEPPQSLVDAFQKGSPGLRLVVVTPAEFADGWRPGGFAPKGREIRGWLPAVGAEVILRAAMVPRPLHVSGWNIAANNGRGAPKKTSRMVPPGAVYFFERADGRPFSSEDAERLWLSAMGDRTNEGFGRVVPGTWFPTRSSS